MDVEVFSRRFYGKEDAMMHGFEKCSSCRCYSGFIGESQVPQPSCVGLIDLLNSKVSVYGTKDIFFKTTFCFTI